MKRWISVLIVTLLIVTGIAGTMRAYAQGAPTGGQVREVDIPVGRKVSLSPDGTKLVSIEPGEQLCVYQVETMAEVSCADISALRASVRIGDIAWSPDSARIAFAQDAFRFLRDSDLWLMDAATGELTNLTDDGFDDDIMPTSEGASFFVDVAPSWTPDGQAITFSRSIWTDGEMAGNAVAQIPVSGGEVRNLASITPDRPGIMYLPGAWAPDGSTFYFSVFFNQSDDPQNGIWALDPATGGTTQIATTDDPELGTLAVRMVSPADGRLLAYYPLANARGYLGKSVQRFVDPATGAISQIPDPNPESEIFQGSWFSTFSPDGRYLLQPNGIDGAFDFWVTDLDTGESTVVAEALEHAVPADPQLTIVWASNGLAGVARDISGAYFFPIDGAGLATDDAATPVSATPQPASSPVASAGGTPMGGDVRFIELPEGRAVSMSPDGTKIAAVVLPSTSLCIYDLQTEAQISCADLTVLNSGIRTQDIVWSPDSTRLAFGENAFLNFKDGDLWVMDAASGALTNLSDDHYDGAIMFLSDADDDVAFTVEVSPAWTPDGQFLTFSGTQFRGNDLIANVIAQVPADGSEDIETLVTVSTEAPGVAYFGTGWSPDGQRFYYSVAHPEPDNPDNGIWVYDKTTGTAELLAASDDPDAGTLALHQVSPAGDRLLAYYPNGLAGMGHLEQSMLRFVDTATGALSPVPNPEPSTGASQFFQGTWIATFSPDGRYLFQMVGIDAGNREAFVTDLVTGQSTLVASGLERAVPIEYALRPVWASNGLLFVSYATTGAYVFPIDGVPPAAGATPVAGTATLTVGEDAVTLGLVPVFVGPDPDSPIALFLPPNHTVHILAEPIENADGTWVPIFDPESQFIGYIQGGRLAPAD